jgi:uncharacterized membrane protein YczE
VRTRPSCSIWPFRDKAKYWDRLEVRLLQPIPTSRRTARLGLLIVGLALYGISAGLMLQAGLGQMPWGVLDQGLAGTIGVQVGTASIAVGAVVLLLWIPLRQRPGLGTVLNVVLVGLSINATLAVVPVARTPVVQVPLLVAGVILNAVATGAYIGAGLGPGPRDGLTTGLAARGLSLRVVRTTIELGVLAAGWLMGGTVGWGTVAYAAAIGPLAHVTIPALRLHDTGRARRRPRRSWLADTRDPAFSMGRLMAPRCPQRPARTTGESGRISAARPRAPAGGPDRRPARGALRRGSAAPSPAGRWSR